MRTTRLLNSELSYEISRIGHNATLTLCDAGLPIPKGVKRIDLAIERGYPTFLRTLDVMLSEMIVEEITVAKEIHDQNPDVYRGMLDVFRAHKMTPRIVVVPHAEFKKLIESSEAVIRTGENTVYANVILKAGVSF